MILLNRAANLRKNTLRIRTDQVDHPHHHHEHHREHDRVLRHVLTRVTREGRQEFLSFRVPKGSTHEASLRFLYNLRNGTPGWDLSYLSHTTVDYLY